MSEILQHNWRVYGRSNPPAPFLFVQLMNQVANHSKPVNRLKCPDQLVWKKSIHWQYLHQDLSYASLHAGGVSQRRARSLIEPY